MTTVTIPYKPRPYFVPFHENRKRWICLVCHRRAGKTTAVINHLQRDALRTPDSLWGFIGPTYKQTKLIAWDILKRYARPIPGVEFNEQELTAHYPNGAKLRLFGSDYPDSLRGIGFWGVGLDEYPQQPANIFSEIIRPALADHQGYAIFLGTPKGRNEFYRVHERAKRDPGWFHRLLTVKDTGIISEQELADARKVMTPDEFLQEWFCSFDASIRGAYYADEIALARKEQRFRVVPYDKALPVHTVWDLGLDDAMAIGFYQRGAGQLRMIDYHEDTDKGLLHYIKLLQTRPYVYGRHFAPHDIKVRELTTGVSRWETAKNLGILFRLIPNVSVQEGIHAGRMAFSRLFVDEERCRTWLDYIAQYRKEWDQKRGLFRDNPLHDFTSHAADVHRYASLVEKQMTSSPDPMPARFYDQSKDLWNA